MKLRYFHADRAKSIEGSEIFDTFLYATVYLCYNIHLRLKGLDQMRSFKYQSLIAYASTLIGIFRHAESPVSILYHYLIRKTPKKMKTKSGLIVRPSSNKDDIITFVVVFCKRDYGHIRSGSVVVDVGANIGLFALYAISEGASFVECFEPCKESFEVLNLNIKLNGFESNIRLHNKAVAGRGGSHVLIPTASNPRSQTSELKNGVEYGFEKVETISLEKSLASYSHIDLIKMDCEGAEFDIIPSLTPLFLDKVDEIRMELHGTIGRLMDCFSYQPFEIIHKGESNIWLIKKQKSQKQS